MRGISEHSRRWIWLAAIVLCLGAFAALGAYRRLSLPRPVEVGERAPAFALPRLGGGMFSLPGRPGKIVFLNFFTTWCPPCQTEAPDFARFADRHGNQVELVMVDRREGPALVRSFVRRYRLWRAAVLLDRGDILAEPYGVTGQPETFGITRAGIVAFHAVGPLSYRALQEKLRAMERGAAGAGGSPASGGGLRRRGNALRGVGRSR